MRLSNDDIAAIEARIRAFEARTGTQAVTAIADRSDRYHGLRWRAFALGVAVAAPIVVLADALRPDWIHAHAVLFAVAAILAVGLACALLATVWPAFERMFLQRERAEAEVRQHAKSLFLARELFATPGRNAVLLLASRFERIAVVLGDRGYEGRVSRAEWQRVVDAMTQAFRSGNAQSAFTAGLAKLESTLVARGFRGDGTARNVISDRPIEPKADEP